MSFKARRCHFERSGEEKSNATLGSQEWFTGPFLIVGYKNKKYERLDGACVWEVRVGIDEWEELASRRKVYTH